ncbi:MAG TPA: hypothetical protein VEC12_00250 [Bacteroidia bacterium]|nr:hypothetical protein [Bacteroidia bacterium]
MKRIILLSLAALLTITTFGQLTIDLSETHSITKTIDITVKPKLTIQNMLPALPEGCQYVVEINQEEKIIPPISAGGLNTLVEAQKKDLPKCVKEKEFMERYDNLKSAGDEAEIKKYVKELNEYINGVLDTECINMGKQLIGLTIKEIDLALPIKYNQVIKVFIYKRCDGKNVQIWEYTYKTPDKTPWKTMLGFTVIPNILNPVTNYYTKQSDINSTEYVVSPLNNQRKDFFENVSPTFMVQWAPLRKYNHSWKAIFSNNFYQFGFTGGLSLNFAGESSLANVMAGPSIVIADNMSLSFGLIMTRKSVLRGNYVPDEIVTEQLTFDQLHEKRYMVEYFFSLAFRFDQNPFKRKETPEGED